MSFNIRYDNPDDVVKWKERKWSVSTVIHENDIVGLQEVLVHQLEFLKEQRPEYKVVGVGRDDGKQAGEFAPILIDTSKFEVTDWRTIWLSPTPEDTASVGWDAALTRIATMAKISSLVGGHKLFVINTHFDHQGKTAREESARLIKKYVDAVPEDHAVVVLGDLNAEPDSEVIDILTTGRLADLFYLRDGFDTYVGFENEFAKRIDYILYDNVIHSTMATVNSQVDEFNCSDHVAISMKFDF